MRRNIAAGLSLFLVAGCAMTAPGVSRAPDQAVRLAGTGQTVLLSGEMVTTRRPVESRTEPRHDLVVRVNGQPAIQGTLVTYGTTTLTGAAGAMPASATCQSREIGHADRQFDCLVTLNGQPAARMAFRATPSGPQPPVGGA